ncbi:MAG: hypothetical protein ACUVRU_10195, partial [Anaerolineae bacterium]
MTGDVGRRMLICQAGAGAPRLFIFSSALAATVCIFSLALWLAYTAQPVCAADRPFAPQAPTITNVFIL